MKTWNSIKQSFSLISSYSSEWLEWFMFHFEESDHKYQALVFQKIFFVVVEINFSKNPKKQQFFWGDPLLFNSDYGSITSVPFSQNLEVPNPCPFKLRTLSSMLEMTLWDDKLCWPSSVENMWVTADLDIMNFLWYWTTLKYGCTDKIIFSWCRTMLTSVKDFHDTLIQEIEKKKGKLKIELFLQKLCGHWGPVHFIH